MSAQLTLDEMLACLAELNDPRAQHFRTILESIGTVMAQTLAEKLRVVALPAISEGPDLAGTCAGFHAAFEGQDCPATIAAFDSDGWYVRSAEGLIGPLGDRKQANAEHTKIQLHRERLFNCCHSNMAPDWSCFALLTVRGCKDDPDDTGHTLGFVADEEAEFWSVYAREKDGCSQAITDCITRTDAEQIAQELSKLSGLEIAP